MEFTISSSADPTEPNNNPEFFGFGLSKEVGIQQNSALRSKSSQYRGVQKIRDKETYVAHVYDNGHSPNEARTLYLGRFDSEEKAARAHDLVSLKFWGTTAVTNFPLLEYYKEIETMANMSDQDVMAAVRRSSNSFSRGKSKFRGVIGHSSTGKWQARKGPGKDSFLGTYDTEEEAAIAFDVASIKQKGFKAITNYDISSYNVMAILEGEFEEGEGTEDASTFQRSNRRSKKRFANLQQYLMKKTESSPSINPNPNFPSSEKAVFAPSVSWFQDGATLIPFFSKSMWIGSSSNEPDSNLTSGFKHSSSSAFQFYKPKEPAGESSINQEANLLAPHSELWGPNLHPYYENSLFGEREFGDPGLGFQHASSSCFQPFTKH